MIDLKQGDGNFIINHTYVPKDKITFIITDEYISFQGYYPAIGSQGRRYSYSDFTLDGVVCESNAQFIDWIQANCFKKKVAFDVYFKGVADSTTEPEMEGGVMYIVLAPATLPNFKDSEGTAITVTQDDLDAGDVFLIGTDGVFDKQVDATREYVDTLFALTLKTSDINNSCVLAKNSAGNIFGIGYTPNAVANTNVIRDANGRTHFIDPIVDADAATKGYVDSVTMKKTQITALTKIASPSTPEAILLNQLIDALKA